MPNSTTDGTTTEGAATSPTATNTSAAFNVDTAPVIGASGEDAIVVDDTNVVDGATAMVVDDAIVVDDDAGGFQCSCVECV